MGNLHQHLELDANVREDDDLERGLLLGLAGKEVLRAQRQPFVLLGVVDHDADLGRVVLEQVLDLADLWHHVGVLRVPAEAAASEHLGKARGAVRAVQLGVGDAGRPHLAAGNAQSTLALVLAFGFSFSFRF